MKTSTLLVLLRRRNLVTNGTFDNGTTGWSASNATLSVDTARLKVLTTSAVSNGGASQAITCIPGRVYEVRVTTTAGSGNAGWGIGLTLGNAQNYFTGFMASGWPTSTTFTATTTTHYITLAAETVDASQYAFFDNISVR